MNKTNGLIVLLLIAVLASLFFGPHPEAAGVAILPATTSEATVTAGVNVVCGNGAEGSYTELIASTAATSYYQTIAINSNSANDVIVDIATGAGGSESPKIVNLAFLDPTSGVPAIYSLPMTIPAGSRISARCYGGGVVTATLYLTVFE